MSRPIRVLLIEDSDSDAQLLLLELRQNGYKPVYERVETAPAMLAALTRQPWDVVIADYVLPSFSGPKALKLLQERGIDLPFIIVSGHIDEDTAVASMKAGAHDYVMKDRLTRLVPAIEREIQEAEVRRARKREIAFRLAIEESIPSGIVAVDSEGKFNYVNSVFCDMVGWTEAELMGSKPPYVYWPRDKIEVHQQALARVIEGKTPPTGFELCFQHKNGKRFDVLLLANPIKDSQGQITGWLASVTDITERIRAQDALRRAHDELEVRVQERTADLKATNAKLENSIQERARLEHELLEITEKERRRIGLDLHDDLGQKLAGITMMIKGLEIGLKKKRLPEADSAHQISELVTQAMHHASGLARDLSLAELEEDNLAAALNVLSENVKKLFQITCRFKHEGSVPQLDRNTITQFYKITQEAVTNAVKHGKTKQVAIHLVNTDSTLMLTIRNDGMPFPSMIDQNKGMGLRIMKYRANTIGASVDVKPAKPTGTVVTCLLPLNAKTAPGKVKAAHNGHSNGKPLKTRVKQLL
ncbi:MAG: Multi-sensor signal transduction histidine kinase [Pedosphaera sp.]|nr:Multi-sensor signal transduction histidine kinase [Pedosphaera sp.]